MTTNHKFATNLVCAAVMVLVSAMCIADAHAGPAETKVFLNGQPTVVSFNDGDSFRVLRGKLKDAKARIAGFNTLEAHGAVHQWGNWKAKEMYTLAKMATLHARRGVWECTTDGKLDTYGRMLTFCPSLGEELIRLGYAHALTITDEPADPTFLAAQKQAIEAKRGIWAHGVPPFVVTSLHSVEEDLKGTGTYNRTISVQDGHTVSWQHKERYKECQNVCKMAYPIADEAKLAEVVTALQADDSAKPLIEGLPPETLAKVVRDYAQFRHVDREIAKQHRFSLVQLLDGYRTAGKFGPEVAGKPVSCMIHVPFKRRYGTGKAACLK